MGNLGWEETFIHNIGTGTTSISLGCSEEIAEQEDDLEMTSKQIVPEISNYLLFLNIII